MKKLLILAALLLGIVPAQTQKTPAIPDQTAPTVSVTAPSNGATALTGAVPITVTCTDPVLASSVRIYIDNAPVVTLTTSPFSTTWTTTNYVDGSHAIYATCNAGGVMGTSPTITVSTANGIAAKTVYIDPTSATDCPTNTGLSTSSPCKTFAGTMSLLSSNPLHGGDSILLKAGTNLTLSDLTSATVLSLCGPSVAGLSTTRGQTYCPRRQNVYPGATITLSTYGGSGNCHILSGVTTDCAAITFSNTNGTVYRNFAPIGIFNVPNMVINNLRIIGNQTASVPCTGSSNQCAQGFKYVAANGFFVGNPSVATIISNMEIVDFFVGAWIAAYPDLGLTNGASMCNVNFTQSYIHGSTIFSAMDVGLYGQGVNCFSGTTGMIITQNYMTNIGGIPGGQGTGVGIEEAGGNQSQNQYANYIVENYNAIGGLDNNVNTCGGGYSLEMFFQQNSTMKGNEGWNNFPSHAAVNSAGGATVCDNGAFDLDNGVASSSATFNYGHETWGPTIGTFIYTAGKVAMGPNMLAYNIAEDGSAYCHLGSGQCSMFYIGSGTGGPIDVYNNAVWHGYDANLNPVTGQPVVAGAWADACPPSGISYVSNNIVVAAGGSNGGGFATMYYAFDCAHYNVPPTQLPVYQNNDYYALAGTMKFITGNSVLTGLPAWESYSGETPKNVNPSFAGSGGGAATICYSSPLSGLPVQPGTLPCPTNYELQTGSTLIGTGLNLTKSPYSLTLPETDYFNGTIPNGVGTGYNLGPHGAHH